MSLKTRLQRLEDSQKAKADAVSHGVTAEQSRQTLEWLNATIQSINDGTPGPPPSPPRDMSRYSPAQLKAFENTMAWLDQITNESNSAKGAA
jgi:hypothetical protein